MLFNTSHGEDNALADVLNQYMAMISLMSMAKYQHKELTIISDQAPMSLTRSNSRQHKSIAWHTCCVPGSPFVFMQGWGGIADRKAGYSCQVRIRAIRLLTSSCLKMPSKPFMAVPARPANMNATKSSSLSA